MKRAIIGTILTCVLMVINSAYGQNTAPEKPLTLKKVKQAIIEKGASWTAVETWVSKLPPEDRRMVYGASREKTLAKISPQDQIWGYPGQPEWFDWRDVEGQNWITPIRNQGGCGSCVAFMTLGTVEGVANIYHNDPDLDLNLSEQHLFSCGGGTCEDGLNRIVAFQYVLENGVPDEACFPYSANDLACSWTCDDWQSRATTISCWNWVGGTSNVISPAVIKEKLLEGPLAVTMTVYGDFNYYNGGVYEYVSGDPEAGHGIVLVGWDDTTTPPCWICKNSWGTLWGENGWFRIKMGDNQCGIEEGVIFAIMGELPDIHVSETFHDFGTVGIGETAEWPLPIANTGEGDLSILGVDFNYGEFGVQLDLFPQTVSPGDTFPLTLTFSPTIPYVQAGIATIRSNDCLDGAIDIRLFGSGVQNNIVAISVTEACAYPGETAYCAIDLDNQKYKDVPCSRVDVNITFDHTLLHIIEVSPTARTQSLDLFSWEESSPGTLEVTAMDTSGGVIDVGTGSIATLLFTILNGTQFGQYSDVVIEDLLILDAEGDSVQTETVDSYVGVYCRGDVNLDGSINVLDMINTINFILNIGDPPTEYQFWAADCTGDENIDFLDVLGIANSLLGHAPCQP